jgi:cation transport regulator
VIQAGQVDLAAMVTHRYKLGDIEAAHDLFPTGGWCSESRDHTLSAVPYLTTDDLPDSVRGHLPAHAQAIYLAAFNNAWRQHAWDADVEATVHRIAWSAVKRR